MKKTDTTIKIIIGGLILLGIFWIILPNVRDAMGVYFFITIISYFGYKSKILDRYLIGFSKVNGFSSVIYGIIAGLSFFFITKLVPGFSIGFPNLSYSVGSTMRGIIINLIAPVFESIFVQGLIFAYLKSFKKTRGFPYFAWVSQAIIFAFIHLGAFISGFYILPSFAIAFTSISANIGVFITAFLFALIAGFIVELDGVRNLLFVAVFHGIVNFLVYINLVVVFIALPLIEKTMNIFLPFIVNIILPIVT